MFGFALRASRSTSVRGNGLLHAPSIASRKRLIHRANAVGTYRERQRRRVELGVGTLADYAWYGTESEWQRARALACAGREDLI
jgi:hypothetical protein